jgi:single-strand DNA-binding protein
MPQKGKGRELLNRTELIGNLGADPEIRTMTSGDKVATFSLATSDRWTDKNTGEKKENTEWHRITVFGDGLVGIVERFLSKGSKVYLAGKLRTRKWTDKDNRDRWTTEIVLSGPQAHLEMLDKLEGDREPTPPPPSDLDDEIPF